MAAVEPTGDELALGEVLGEGGAARVYAARWRGIDACAKVAHAAGDTTLAAELAAADRVQHPALAPVLGSGMLADGRPYLVLPRLAGEDLATRLARAPLPIADTLAVARTIGGALEALHRVGLVHRDVKPENVMMTATGAVLIDLGVARELERSTISVRVLGTHDHVAPERLFGEPATIASEVYELAVLVWMMLTARLPWPPGAGPAGRRVIGNGLAPAALDEVLRRALSTIPERRPASIEALLADLDAACASAKDAGVARETQSLHAPARAPAAAAVSTGDVLGETYRLGEVLGAGGAGKVFAAEHLRLPRRFAIKVLQADRDDADARARFRREAETIAAVAHPRIVEVFDYDIDDRGWPYMVMRLLVGETLRDRLRRGALEPAEVAAIVTQTASAIEAAHQAGVVHRDLKPSNVFLNAGDAIDVTVLDFGIAKLLDDPDSTIAGALLGTPGYVAPEQITGGDLGPAADVFAIAAIAYEALTGTRAFDAPTRDGILYQICHAEPPRLPASPAIDRVIRAGLAKQPSRRIASAAAFADAFADAVAHPAPRRRRAPWIAGALVTAGGVATALAFAGGRDRPAAAPVATSATSVPQPVPAPPPAPTRQAPAPPSPVTVPLILEPRTAHATLDGKPVTGPLQLAPGPHELRVTAAGHKPVSRTIDVASIGGELKIVLPRVHAARPKSPNLRSLIEH